MRRRFWRGGLYTFGMLVLALGITLNTKAGLGVSAIVSIAYCASQMLGLRFGDMTFVVYSLFLAAQFVIRGRDSRAADLLQLPLSLAFSRLLNLLGALIPYNSAYHGVVFDFGVLLAGVFFTGVGIVLTLNMRLIANPGDGIVQALADRTGWEQGLCKNLCDISCVCITLALGLWLKGRVVGVGVGTLVSMLGTGRVVSLTNRLFKEKMCVAAGVA